VLTGPFSPLFGPLFRAKRAGSARLDPLRAGLGQKLKPAGSAGPARFWPGFTGPGPARLAISSYELEQLTVSASMTACTRLHTTSCGHSSSAAAATSRDSADLLLSHSFGTSFIFIGTAAASLSNTVRFAGGSGGSLTLSSDDLAEDSAELSVELPSISMRPNSCVDSRSPVSTSTTSTCFGCCCCISGAKGDHIESVECLAGLAEAGCRPVGAGELTAVLPFSVCTGEGGCVTDGVVAACSFSDAGEPGVCVSSDEIGVSAGRGALTVAAAALACPRSFFLLRKHEPKDGIRGFRYFLFFLCLSVAPKPLWFGMAYAKNEGSSSWACCCAPAATGASRTFDGVRCRCLLRLRLRLRLRCRRGHRKRGLSGLKEQHGVARSSLLPPKHLHRARRWDFRPRARGVVDMAAGMAGRVWVYGVTVVRNRSSESPCVRSAVVRGVVAGRVCVKPCLSVHSLRAEHY
jgi:hypothetical protein